MFRLVNAQLRLAHSQTVVRCTDSTPGKSQDPPLQIDRFSTTPSPLEMGRQIPQLPPEIIILIVKASLTPYDPFGQALNHAARYTTLRKFALLDSIWRGISQPLLHEWVMITGKASALRLLDAARAQGGRIKGAQSLCIFPDSRWKVDFVAKLLRCVQDAENVYLYFVQVDVAALAGLPNLRRLSLASVNIKGDDHSVKLQIPHLRHLDCDSADIEPYADFFLTPNFLPSLRHFRLHSAEGRWMTFPLIGQLSSLSTDTPLLFDYALPASIRLLSLPRSAGERRQLFRRFASMPRFLHFAFSEPGCIVAALEEQIASKKSGLRVIIMSCGQATTELSRKIADCVRVLEERGVRFVKGSVKYEHAVKRMEEILEKERMAVEDAAIRGG